MSEVGFSSISAPGLSRDLVNKPFKNSYSFISENAYVKPEGENKEVIYLKKTVSRLEQNMNFIQHEHCQMLEGLQKQIDKLREENHDLQFQLVMRSDRNKDLDNKTLSKPKDSNQNNPKLLTDQLHHLKQELDGEKRKNKELLEQLEILKNKSEEIPKDIQYVETLEPAAFTDNNVFISPDIRISLNPLAVSTFHHDSGSFIMKTPLTVQDCEMVIQTLLQKIDCTPNMRENSVSSRSLSGNQRLKLIPGIKKPLQPIKPMSRGSSNIKLASLTGSQTVKTIGLPSTQKLIPILSHKNETIKLEHESQGFNGSRKSDRDHKILDNLPISAEVKTGSSLPALPKPNDFNQAEKHRRLHMLQKKRLDQYNNR